MLVCSVSVRPRHVTVVADLIEAGAALDVADYVALFGTLLDSPGNASDTINAVVGQFMVETASAAAVVTAGTAYRITVLEDTTAIDNNLAVVVPKKTVAATVTEAATATATQSVVATAVVALYETAHVASTMTSSLLGTDVPDSGPVDEF